LRLGAIKLSAADGIPSVAVRQLPDHVHWADSPWSAPRLRGRGEQGAIVSVGIPFFYALYRAD